MKEHGVGAVVVTDDHKVVGIVTDRDIALAITRENFSIDDTISTIMTSEVKTIWEDQGVFNATQYLKNHGVRRLPIIDRHDNLVGMVTADDLFGLLARETFNIAQALEPALGNHI
jgi:CBS domain-containing protein